MERACFRRKGPLGHQETGRAWSEAQLGAEGRVLRDKAKETGKGGSKNFLYFDEMVGFYPEGM